eukprot:1703467-Amphidinium_carterae.4
MTMTTRCSRRASRWRRLRGCMPLELLLRTENIRIALLVSSSLDRDKVDAARVKEIQQMEEFGVTSSAT